MEGGHEENMNSSNNIGINGGGGARWNPTKDQINMLENFYKQGLRTPTAEQIQQITNRLRAFGHIEGKNVFYWFQNHKARQRQRQKQKLEDNLAFYNRFFYPPTPPILPPFQNVVCSPCYIQSVQNGLGFQQQYPNVPLSAAGGFISTKITETNIERNKQPLMPRYNTKKITMQDHPRHHHHHHEDLSFNNTNPHGDQETLDLFPIHPTGILEAKHNIGNHKKNIDDDDENDSCNINFESPSGNNDAGHPYFDFFCGKLN